MKKLSKEDIKNKAQNIKKIYQDFLVKLSLLNKKQNDVISNLIKKIEKRKMEDARKYLEKL